MSSKKVVTMYSKENCSQCDVSKMSLSSDPEVELVIKKLDTDFNREFLLERFPAARMYPQFDLDGQPVGNFNQLADKLLSK
ncbi:glutaredoxin [Vibrio phage 150E35-1]|nr:glutaredoxin [Vibrio phage 150E35-1]